MILLVEKVCCSCSFLEFPALGITALKFWNLRRPNAWNSCESGWVRASPQHVSAPGPPLSSIWKSLSRGLMSTGNPANNHFPPCGQRLGSAPAIWLVWEYITLGAGQSSSWPGMLGWWILGWTLLWIKHWAVVQLERACRVPCLVPVPQGKAPSAPVTSCTSTASPRPPSPMIQLRLL